MAKAKTTKTRRHIMRFDLGGPRPITHYVKVVKPKSVAPVELKLTDEDARIAIKQKGIGDATRCAGAVCVMRHGHLFSHPVHYIDWTPSRAYAVTKLDKHGLPSECVCYVHQDNVARLFDTPRGGYQKLRKIIEQRGGALTLRLIPSRVYKRAESGKRTSHGDKKPMTAAQRAARSLPRGVAGRIFHSVSMIEAAMARKSAGARP